MSVKMTKRQLLVAYCLVLAFWCMLATAVACFMSTGALNTVMRLVLTGISFAFAMCSAVLLPFLMWKKRILTLLLFLLAISDLLCCSITMLTFGGCDQTSVARKVASVVGVPISSLSCVESHPGRESRLVFVTNVEPSTNRLERLAANNMEINCLIEKITSRTVKNIGVARLGREVFVWRGTSDTLFLIRAEEGGVLVYFGNTAF